MTNFVSRGPEISVGGARAVARGGLLLLGGHPTAAWVLLRLAHTRHIY